MKKILMMLAAILCCTMTTTVLTSCSDDDPDEGGNKTPEQAKIVGFQVDYSLTFPKDITNNTGLCGNLYLLCDKIEVGYVDEKGEEKREEVNNGKWSKSVTYSKSFKGYLKLYLTKPSNLDGESLPYDYYTRIINMTPDKLMRGITAIFSDGTKGAPTGGIGGVELHIPNITIGKNKVPLYMEEKFKEEMQVMTIELNI